MIKSTTLSNFCELFHQNTAKSQFMELSNFCHSEERSDEESPITRGILRLPSVAQDDSN